MFDRYITRFSPPPDFLTGHPDGLSLGDNHIRVVSFNTKNNSVVLEKYGSVSIEEGSIKGGEIIKRDNIVSALKKAKEEYGLINVNVSLPEERAYLFEMELPFVSPKDIRNTIEFKIEENVPLPASQIVFDYDVVFVDKNNDKIKAIVLALPIVLVLEYVAVFNEAGLRLNSLEIESQAAARVVVPNDIEGSCLVVSMGSKKMSISIVSDKVVRFTSTINNIDPMENIGATGIEIKKILNYWYGQNRQSDNREKDLISKIILCGKISDKNIITQLSSFVDVPVHLGNVWGNYLDIDKLLPQIPFIESLTYASAIGLALPAYNT